MAFLPSVIETIEVSQNKEYVKVFLPMFKRTILRAVQKL